MNGMGMSISDPVVAVPCGVGKIWVFVTIKNGPMKMAMNQNSP